MSPTRTYAAPLLLGALAAAFSLASACIVFNENHCSRHEGACSDGLVCDVCEIYNDGCVAIPAPSCEFVASTNEPTSEPSSEMTTDDPSTTGPEPTTTGSEPTTMGPDPTSGMTDETWTTTGVPSCDPEMPDVGCASPSQPYCVGVDVCGTCDELSDCVSVDPQTPACDASSGYCVECTASQIDACTNPNEATCNPYTRQCDVCFEHSQCASMACNLETGICFPDNNIIWVKARPNCAGEDGSQENPYCSLAYAIEEEAQLQVPIIIKLLHEADPQTQAIVIDGGYEVAILNGEDGGQPMPVITTSVFDQSALIVDNGANVFIDGVRFHENPQQIAQPMIVLDDSASRLYIDRSVMTNNTSLAWAKDGEMYLRRTVVSGNIEGVLVSLGTVVVENSYFSHNGTPNNNADQPPGTNKYAPLYVHADGEVRVTYTTFVANASLFASVFDCSGASNLNNSRIRNSVLIGKIPLENNGNNMGCGSVIDPETNYMVAFPKVLGDFDLNDIFDGEAVGGVYRALARGDLMDVATRKDEDPYMDFDGEGRPLYYGSPDYAGADNPSP